MSLIDKYFAAIPAYNDYMYKDGFSPEQILYAHHKKMYEIYNEDNDDYEIVLVPEVRNKK